MSRRITGGSAARRAAAVAVLLGVLVAAYFAYGALAAPPVPAPTISVFPANPTNVQSASFTYTDSVAITKFQCALDGSSFTDCGTTRPSMKSYAGPLAVGSHTFQVKAVSGAQSSAPTAYTWLIDRTAPTVVSINRANPSPTNAASVSWTVTFSEPVTGVASNGSNFSLVAVGLTGSPGLTGASGASATYTLGATTGTGTSGATNTLQARLSSSGTIKDVAGNALGGSLPFNGQTYVIDKTAPNAPFVVLGPFPYPPLGWASTTAPFLFGDSSSDVVSFQCKLDAGGYAACSNPATFTGLAQGVHTVLAKAVDAAGNVSGASSPSVFFVDTVPPSVPTLTSFPPDPSSSSQATFAWTDTDPAPASGIALYLCSRENGPYLPCSSPFTFTVQTTNNGQHQFAVEAVDWAGNISGPKSYSWKVVVGSGAPFTIAGNASGLLYPGAPLTPIALTITNPNAVPIYVTALTVTATNSPNGCTNAANIVISQSPVAPTANEMTVPASVTNWPVPAAFQPKIRLADTGSNQDVCKNQTFSLSYTGSAHS